MTIDTSVTSRLEGRSLGWRVGASTTAAIFVVLLAWAISVDFPKATGGFFADGATYYEMTHSLASDLDLEYRREDLARVWREYPGGPEGLFLKRGRDVDVRITAGFPFVTVTTVEDPDRSRLYYGKAYLFPVFAAPFVFVFGTNGFLVMHAVLMALCFLCGYAFLVARSHPVAALIFTFTFLFISATPVYMVQLMPDFFNLALVMFGYFFWCYKEVVGPDAPGRSRPLRVRWLLSPRSDAMAALLLGLATFAKPTLMFVIAPLLVSAMLRRQWWRGLRIGAIFGGTVVALFAINIAITGEWNYQGGERRTFYSNAGGFPFQDEQKGFDIVGLDRTTNRVPLEVLTSRDAVFDVLLHNLVYFVVGRHHGFAAYYFPGVMALLLFLLATRDRAAWQWLTLGAAVLSALFLLLYMPFTYSGGGGPVGNRYYLGVYPLFLFLVPPLQRASAAIATAGISALFVAPIVFNPFYAAFHPAEHPKVGLFRLLPTELTLVNDLPVNVTPSRKRQELGGMPPVQAYFLDDNAYNREGDAFWVRGESRADILLRAPIDIETDAPVPQNRSLRIDRLLVHLETGPKANRVTVSTGADYRVIDMAAGSRQSFEVEMPRGVPYRPDPRFPTNYVYEISVATTTGFVPRFENGAPDDRFLGVMVWLVPQYGGQQ